MLTELHTLNVGPASQFEITFGNRLNLFTGDNGLGKTFLLDMIWRGLTDTWTRNIALPFRKNGQKAEITYRIKTEARPQQRVLLEAVLKVSQEPIFSA